MRVRVFVTKPETRLSCSQGGSTQRPPPCCASPPRRGCAFVGAVVVGVSHTLSGARAPGWRCSATRRPAGPAGPAAAAAAGAQHAAPLALLPRRLAAVALRRCDGGERESHEAAPERQVGAVQPRGVPQVLLARLQRRQQGRSTQRPSPCCLAASPRLRFVGAMVVSVSHMKRRQSARLALFSHAASRRSC